MRKTIEAIEKIIREYEIKVISVDVFDTLLLRSTRPELQRLKDFSKAQFNELTRSPFEDYLGLYKKRLDIGKKMFTASQEAKGTYEVTYRDWISQIFGEGPDNLTETDDFIQKCLEIELSLEKRSLKPNKVLWNYLNGLREVGITIVFCSDMYLNAKAIRQLLSESFGEGFSQQMFVSSDRQNTKRDGGLFLEMVNDLDVKADHVLHLGDNRISDVLVPKKLGIHTLHLPRNVYWELVYNIRKKMYNVYLRQVR